MTVTPCPCSLHQDYLFDFLLHRRLSLLKSLLTVSSRKSGPFPLHPLLPGTQKVDEKCLWSDCPVNMNAKDQK